MRDRRILALVDQMCSADTSNFPSWDRRPSSSSSRMSAHCTARRTAASRRSASASGPPGGSRIRRSRSTAPGEGARSGQRKLAGSDAAAPAGDDDDAAAPVVAAAESAAAAAACGVDGCAGVRAAEPGSEPTPTPTPTSAPSGLFGSAGAVRGGGGDEREAEERSDRGEHPRRRVRLNQRVGQRAGREELHREIIEEGRLPDLGGAERSATTAATTGFTPIGWLTPQPLAAKRDRPAVASRRSRRRRRRACRGVPPGSARRGRGARWGSAAAPARSSGVRQSVRSASAHLKEWSMSSG